jgi:hypothetical protein
MRILTWYGLLFFLCSHICLCACDRCDAIDEYINMNIIWDMEHQYQSDDETCLYWYLEGRLSAWDEIKYVESDG